MMYVCFILYCYNMLAPVLDCVLWLGVDSSREYDFVIFGLEHDAIHAVYDIDCVDHSK